jgi:predicted N-acetyltransferase YhbS
MALSQSLIDAVAQSRAAGVTTHVVTPDDYAAIGALHDRVFGPGALTRTAYRIREGLPPQTSYCRLARDRDGTLMGFIRFAPIRIGDAGHALMLGPLAIARAYSNQGHARRLIAEGVTAAAADGQRLIVLVGDAPYYGRLGFVAIPFGQITMPGPVDPARVLALELVAGALAGFRGLVSRDHTAR